MKTLHNNYELLIFYYNHSFILLSTIKTFNVTGQKNDLFFKYTQLF